VHPQHLHSFPTRRSSDLYPARIENMSLGGTGACPQQYIDVVSQLTAKGVLVVASAGNEGGLVDTPANCPGVAGVAGIRHAGTKRSEEHTSELQSPCNLVC